MKKLLIACLKQLEMGSALACRLTQFTGKASIPTHPKHLVNFGQLYYLNYLKKNEIVLDLGCHAGEHSLKVAPRVNHITGLDIDRKLIRLAKIEASRLGITNVDFLVHNLEKKLPFKANRFDKVLFFAVLEHLNHRHQALREIKRVLKPDGTLFISVPNKDSQWKRLQRCVGFSGLSDPDHKIEFSRSQITKLLKDHGFNKIKLQTTALDTPIAGIIDLIGGVSLNLYKRLMLWKLNQGQRNPHNTVGFLISATNA